MWQAQACELDLVAGNVLPPPASYALHTGRFVFLWVSTLPFVLLDGLMSPAAVPFTMLAVAWALYSTEELAQILEEPFGDEQGIKPEVLPLDQYVSTIVSDLKRQALVQRAIDRRVANGMWVVRSSDIEPTMPVIDQ